MVRGSPFMCITHNPQRDCATASMAGLPEAVDVVDHVGAGIQHGARMTQA